WDAHRLRRLGRGEPRVQDRIGREDFGNAGRADALRLALVEAEVVEVQVAPAAAVVVGEDDPDRDAELGVQVDRDRLHRLRVGARAAKKTLLLALPDELERGALVGTSTDEEAGPGLRDLEGRRDERPLRRVARELVAADPELSCMEAPLAMALRRQVAAHRLAREGLALRSPVAQVAALEVGVERMAVEPEREGPLLARLEGFLLFLGWRRGGRGRLRVALGPGGGRPILEEDEGPLLV